MAESIFASLLGMLDKRTVGDVAHSLGQPEQGVSQGLEYSLASILGGLTQKSNDPGSVRKILDLVPSTGTPVSWSQMLNADPNSPLMAAGRRVLPALFGSNDSAVISGISRSSGLPLPSVSTLLSMAAPIVMSFISKRVRDSGMTNSALSELLQKESTGVRGALPPGLTGILGSTTTTTTAGSAYPVIAQSVQREEHRSSWLAPVLGALALAFAIGWLLSHAHQPTTIIHPPVSVHVGGANRFAVPTPAACALPASVTLPQGSAESQLFASLQNPANPVTANNWQDFDTLRFDNGSIRLSPASDATLKNVAAILTNCPDTHLTVAGYTDNVGNADSNLQLSRNRANTVVDELVRLGVPKDRISAQGFGEQFPAGDNSTPEGRAQNRRIAMRLSQQ